MSDVRILVDAIEQRLKNHSRQRLFTAAISGIDASGKGYITKLAQDNLATRGYNVATINVDPWQNPLPVRLQKENAAENFYNNVFRWRDFFNHLIAPLQKNKGIYLETKLIRTDADEYYPFVYDYDDLDILFIEGIFLFQKKYLNYYDYKIWIDCSFETGLKRAIKRNTERLNEEQLINDYNTCYYPAQQLHFKKDNPQNRADIIFNNEE
jgi:uridine kinase